jgi:hypothetical protein
MALVERGADGELVELPELGNQTGLCPARVICALIDTLPTAPVRNNSLTRRIEID